MFVEVITIGSGGSGTIPDRLLNKCLAWVQCPAFPGYGGGSGNTGAITINGLDSYAPGYNGPAGPLPVASITGTSGDTVTIGVKP
jgi:hypothetical protein